MDKAKVLKILRLMVNVLDGKIGDTDPYVDNLTEDEIIEYEPYYWLMHRVLEITTEVEAAWTRAMIENLKKLVDAVGCGDVSGLYLNDIDGQNWFDFRDKLLAEDEECNHNWVSADNDVVTGGLMCTKCFMLNPNHQEVRE